MSRLDPEFIILIVFCLQSWSTHSNAAAIMYPVFSLRLEFICLHSPDFFQRVQRVYKRKSEQDGWGRSGEDMDVGRSLVANFHGLDRLVDDIKYR